MLQFVNIFCELINKSGELHCVVFFVLNKKDTGRDPKDLCPKGKVYCKASATFSKSRTRTALR